MLKTTKQDMTVLLKINSGRFGNIDRLKVLCAFLVVYIHAPVPGTVGEYITALARVAVPIFFMITGFFYNPERSKGQIIKILKLTVIASGIFLLWNVAKALADGALASYIASTFTIRNVLKFLVFNDNPLNSHLWYLSAILYVMIVTALLQKITKNSWKKLLYIVTPLLLICDLVLGKYSIAIFGREFPYIIVRNWLCVGIPYFTIGMWIREREAVIREKSKQWMLVLSIALFAATTLLERGLLLNCGVDATRDHYISTTFLSVALFGFFLLYVKGNENLLSRIGRDNSTWIYIIHPIVITVFGSVASKLGNIGEIYEFVQPIVVFAVTTVAVMLVTKMKKRIFGKK